MLLNREQIRKSIKAIFLEKKQVEDNKKFLREHMRKIQKIIALLLISILVINLGCGKIDKNDTDVSSVEAYDNKVYSPGALTDKEKEKANRDVEDLIDSISQDIENEKKAVTENATADGEDAAQPDLKEALAKSKAEGIDVDLTLLSSTMVYSEVYNMMFTPEDYVGKTIKMTGAFAYYKDETTGKQYYACIITDATACCAQGIEFVLKGNYTYPEDYPELEETITVQGVFDLYDEDGYKYCRLLDAKMDR